MATKTPKEAFDAQRSRIQRLWGLTTQVGGARLITERCTIPCSLGDPESPVADFEVDQNADTFENCHCTNPDHGQGAFTSSPTSSWRAGRNPQFFRGSENWTFALERFSFAASGKLEISTNERYGLGNFWPVKSTNWEGDSCSSEPQNI